MAARKAPLRAVKDGEQAKAREKTLLEAVESGDFLAELKATHKRIAKTVADPDTSARDLAALTRRQLEISSQIRAIKLAMEQEAGASDGPAPDEEFDTSAL